MRYRGAVAIGLVFCQVSFAMAQDAAALEAIFRQAMASEYGAGGTSRDLPQAARLYEQAARQGHAPSMVRLGYMRQSGNGIPVDLPAALALYAQAATKGNTEGQYMEAICYAAGVGTAKDPATARKLLLVPADAGHQDAQYALGIMIALGEGGPKRDAAARRWLDRAASGPDRELAAKAATQRDRIDKSLFAQDTSGSQALLGLLAFIVVAGAVAGGSGGGGGGGGTVSSGTSSGSWGGGAGSSVSTPSSRTTATPMSGNITQTLHGEAAMGIGRPVWRH
jgi:TPR repeat protein